MATLAEFLFEGAAGDGWTSSQGAIDTGVFAEGVQSIYFDCTGAAKQNQLTLAVSKRIVTGRFYYRVKADTSGSASVMQLDNVNGSATMQARVGRKLRVLFGGGTASVDSAALNLDQWYLIDFKVDTSGATGTFVWKINGADQTGATHAQTAADLSNFRLGNTGTNTYQAYFDAVKITDQAGDYALGGINRNAAAGNAAGTGVANADRLSLKPTGGVGSGTGAAASATTKVSPVVGASSGTGAAAAGSTKVAPVVGQASGTGTAGSLTAKVSPSAGLVSGGGSALDPSASIIPDAQSFNLAQGSADIEVQDHHVAIAPVVDIATGFGIAANAQISTTDQAPGDTASGTGAAFDATATTTSAVAATAQAAAGIGSAFDATTTATAIPVAPTGTSTAGKYRKRPTDEFGYPTDMVWKEPPPLDRKPVLVMADIARGYGTAFDPTAQWDDDESALLLLLGIAA